MSLACLMGTFLNEAMASQLCFVFTTLSDLAIDLAVGLAIGGVESIDGNIVINFSS